MPGNPGQAGGQLPGGRVEVQPISVMANQPQEPRVHATQSSAMAL